MMHLIAYDIAHDKRLNAVARTCEDYGIRVQKSLFVCNLVPEDFAQLWRRLSNVIDHEEDMIVDYPICETCCRKRRRLGRQEDTAPLGDDSAGWII